MKVLVVEDSEPMQERLAAVLATVPGAEVARIVNSGQAAIDAVHELRPRAVILDIRLPFGNGIQVLQSIKRTHPHTVVIMFTNHPTAMFRRKCLAAGADYFLDKARELAEIPLILRTLPAETQ